jgi:dTDP-4-amino-4,6-dideoxygalactose transaminase
MFPIAEREAARTIALPFHGGLSEEQVDFVCSQLGQVVREAAVLRR